MTDTYDELRRAVLEPDETNATPAERVIAIVNAAVDHVMETEANKDKLILKEGVK